MLRTVLGEGQGCGCFARFWVKGKGVEGFAGVSEGRVGAIPNSPQRLRCFSKRGEGNRKKNSDAMRSPYEQGCNPIAIGSAGAGRGCENSSGMIQNSPQRLRGFSKRGETLKFFCLSDRREAAKDFWLSALARPAGHEAGTYSTDRIPCPPANTSQSTKPIHKANPQSQSTKPIHKAESPH
jgi:hypothetical protein